MAAERLALGGYVIEHDRDATAAAYSRIAMPGPEECGCWYCRNWAAGRDRTISVEVYDLLKRLGIPLDGEIEVWEGSGSGLSHVYGGWYMLVGDLLETPPPGSENITMDDWKLRLSSKRSYEVPAFAGLKVCEIHFLTEIPDYIEREN